jgi:hypothetical protein
VGPRGELEKVTDLELTVADHDGGHQPVAEHDHDDGRGAQQVDDPVAGSGGRGGEVTHGGQVHDSQPDGFGGGRA